MSSGRRWDRPDSSVGIRTRMTRSDETRCRRGPRDWTGKRRQQRALSRFRQGSRRRRKRKAWQAGLSRKEFVRERNSCHRATAGITREHGLIAVERLKFRNMTRTARRTAEKPGRMVEAKAGMNREIAAPNRSLLRSQLEYRAA